MVVYNPKTKTLFERDDKFKVKVGHLTDERFGYIDKWILTEKMDGTSVILSVGKNGDEFYGRTAKSQFTPAMAQYLETALTSACANLYDHGIEEADIYAELFGEGIQGNPHGMRGMYLNVFDVRIGGFWLDLDNMTDVARKAGLNSVAVMGVTDISGAVKYVRDEQVGITGQLGYVEGVVARTRKYLYDNQGNRLTWKLKRSDFA